MCHVYNKASFFRRLYKFWINYFSPSNFNYAYNLGSLAFICLLLQIITGLFLGMHYKSDVNLAFASIEYINREVYYGWFIRYLHSNGSSVFFLIVYLHILRGFIYGSFLYPRQLVWGSGIIIFILMMMTAFFGYVLPWGQMSYWACTVIITLATAIPIIGDDLIYLILGSYSVDDATLNRFYSLHFFFPFLIVGVTIMHLIFLHEFGSNNPIGLFYRCDGFSILPNYIIKDIHSFNLIFIFVLILVFFSPDKLGHPDNYVLSNSMITPTHIVPEWYFLAFYAILRSVPDKLVGLVLFILSILMLLFLPLIVGRFALIRSIYFKPFFKGLILIFIFNCVLLGWVGGQPVIEPYYFIGQIGTFFYFFLIVLFSFFNYFEQMFLYTYWSYKKIYLTLRIVKEFFTYKNDLKIWFNE